MNEEKHKHRCAVRQFIKYRIEWEFETGSLNKFRDWVKTDRVRPLWLAVQQDYIIQYRLGNRGTWGIWL